MKIFISVPLLLCVTILFYACEKSDLSGPIVIEERSVAVFSKLDTRVAADVELFYAEQQSLKIEASEKYAEQLLTEVVGNTLIIKMKSGIRFTNLGQAKISIGIPNCSAIKSSGSGEMNFIGLWENEDIKINVTGSGNAYFDNIISQKLGVTNTGSANIEIHNGEFDYFNLNSTGSGNFNSINAISKQANIRKTGSGKTTVWVTDHLQLKLTGSGDLFYKGNPTMDLDVTGSGKVKSL